MKRKVFLALWGAVAFVFMWEFSLIGTANAQAIYESWVNAELSIIGNGIEIYENYTDADFAGWTTPAPSPGSSATAAAGMVLNGSILAGSASTNGTAVGTGSLVQAESYSWSNGSLEIFNTDLVSSVDIQLALNWSYGGSAAVDDPVWDYASADVYVDLIVEDWWTSFSDYYNPVNVFAETSPNSIFTGANGIAPYIIPYTIGAGDSIFIDFYVQANGYGEAFSGNTSTVPEPTTLFLFGSGLVGLGCARRRKSKI